MNRVVANQHTLDVLEFEAALALVGRHCKCAMGVEVVHALRPDPFAQGMRSELELVSEAIRALAENAAPPWSNLNDPRPAIAQLEVEGSTLEPRFLRDLSALCRYTKSSLAWARGVSGRFPRLHALLLPIADLSSLADDVEHAIDDEGKVRDRASGELSRLRRHIEVSRERVRSKMESMLRASKDALSESYVTMREGRYVLPVRADRASAVPGLVHDASGSGQTLFVEPMAVVEENNNLRRLESEERREVERILRALTDAFRRRLVELQRDAEVASRLDSVMARAAYASEFGAVVPEVLDEPAVRIAGGRHPLLLDHFRSTTREGRTREVVPLTVELGEHTRTLVITGPNTGGKTVALKTIGLLTLLASSGVPVTAEGGTAFGAFGSIVADIGDAQSIEADLSTFAAHLGRIIEALSVAGPEAFVLLDELGAGTDPVEGEALSRAILDAFTGAGGVTVVTTHLGALKTFPESNEAAANASLEFDSERLAPTYRFRVGLPGSSYALAIASRLGLDRRITAAAESLVGSRERDLERLIASLEESLRVYREKEASIVEKERRYDELARVVEERKRRLDRDEADLRRKAKEEADSIVLETRAEVERLVKQIRESAASKDSVREAQRKLRELRRASSVSPTAPGGRKGDLARLRPGDRVHVWTLDADGEVVAPPDKDGRARVRCGAATIVVHLHDLAPTAADASSDKRTGRVASSVEEGAYELDVRGMYFDDAWREIDRFLDRAVMSGLSSVRLIHGKGTGALRAKISSALAKDPRVKGRATPPEHEGGDGVTIVSLG